MAFAPLLAGFGASTAFAAQTSTRDKVKDIKSVLDEYNTALVLLGTTGGMTWWPQSKRAGNSQVLVVGDAMYVIDLGTGSLNCFAKGFNNDPDDFTTINNIPAQKQLSDFLKPVRALFITHLHMDHLGDYPTFLEIGINTGLADDQKLIVIGPGSRGKLEENTSGYPDTGTRG